MIRYTRSTPCLVCGGCDKDKRGESKRCYGFRSDDGLYVRCTREEFAGSLEREASTNAFLHYFNGLCRCGVTHEPAKQNGHGILLATYEYTDEEDKRLYRVLRYAPKAFSQERWDEKTSSWIGGQGALDGVRRVIYRLPELLASVGIVLIVEGEKDVDTAYALGFTATCNVGGSCKWKVSYNAALKDRDVILIPDADEQGKKHVAQVKEHLEGHAKSIKIIELPAKDLTAWIQDGGTKDELERLIQAPLDWKKTLDAEPVMALEFIDLAKQPVPYLVRPMLVRGSLTQLQGTQKGGKSAFANYLALCAAWGHWPSPTFLTHSQPLNVLYIGWEDPKLMMAHKLRLYAEGMGIKEPWVPPQLTYIFRPYFTVENPQHLAAMKEMVKELKTDFLILDTLAHTHGQDENDNSGMRLPMANLAALAEDQDIAVMYAHHIAKMAAERTAQDKSRGASAIAAAWHVLIDWGVREEGSNVNPVTIQSKFLHKFLNWEITYEHDGGEDGEPTYVKWGFHSREPKISRAKQKQNRMEEFWRIVEPIAMVHPGGIGKYHLMKPLNCSETTAGSYLEAFATQGKLMRSQQTFGGRGYKKLYKLAPNVNPQNKPSSD